jgi:hypothetical protein
MRSPRRAADRDQGFHLRDGGCTRPSRLPAFPSGLEMGVFLLWASPDSADAQAEPSQRSQSVNHLAGR